MTMNAGLDGTQEPLEGGGGSEGLGHDLSAIATACGEFLAVWCDPDAVSQAFGRPITQLLTALVPPDQPTGAQPRGVPADRLPQTRTAANYGVTCPTCSDGGCPDCTDFTL